jgi:hypothetical protein
MITGLLSDNKEEIEMSKALAQVVDPDEIKCTLQFTMTLGDWKQINKTLGSNAAYTELQIMNQISDLVCQLEKVFYSIPDE